jgi:phage baseplate assembly protein V
MNEEIAAALRDIFRIGKVVSTNPENCTARVQFLDTDGLVSGDLQILKPKTLLDKYYSMYDIDEQVACIFLGNGPVAGYILGSLYGQKTKPVENNQDVWAHEFKDGTKIRYDRKEHKLEKIVNGYVDEYIQNDKTVEIDGNVSEQMHSNKVLEVDGNVNEQIHSDKTLEVDGNASEHIHSNKSLEVDGYFDEQIHSDKTVEVDGNSSEHIHGNKATEVDSNVNCQIHGNKLLEVDGNVNEHIHSNKVVEIDGNINEQIHGNKALEIDGNLNFESGIDINLKATGDVNINASRANISCPVVNLGNNASQGVIHAASPCPLFGVFHLLPSQTTKTAL